MNISDCKEMTERLFEHVLEAQDGARTFSAYKGLKVRGHVEYKIIKREETVEKARVFFNKCIEAKEKYKNDGLYEKELKLLETEEIDFEDKNLGVVNMSRVERMVYFIKKARYTREELPYIALDSLEHVLKPDVEIGLAENYQESVKELLDASRGDTKLSAIEALIADIIADLQQAGYGLDIKSKYTVSGR